MKKLIKLLFLTSILTAIVFSIYFLIIWICDKNFDVEINNKEKENIEFGFNMENFKRAQPNTQYAYDSIQNHTIPEGFIPFLKKFEELIES